VHKFRTIITFCFVSCTHWLQGPVIFTDNKSAEESRTSEGRIDTKIMKLSRETVRCVLQYADKVV